MKENPCFRTFTETGPHSVATDDFPSQLIKLEPLRLAQLEKRVTYYGFSTRPFSIDRTMHRNGVVTLPAETCFAIRGPAMISGAEGFAVARLDYVGFDSIVGPIEREGRLQYIDGCTDSLLIGPPKFGDPCLNLLYFPAGISQTQHTHPSNRIGMIASGRGRCVTPHGEIDLLPGVVFNIPRDSLHSFFTDDDELRVVAWHPDSDFGPTDEDHPMIRRTMIGGVSASDPSLASIRTQQ